MNKSRNSRRPLVFNGGSQLFAISVINLSAGKVNQCVTQRESNLNILKYRLISHTVDNLDQEKYQLSYCLQLLKCDF